MADDAPKPFIDRVLQAIDEGFLAQIQGEAGGIVMRIAGGASADVAIRNFDSILQRTIEAHAMAMVIAEQQIKTAVAS
jgi:hypothetical protein